MERFNQETRVVLYGTGSSADYFLTNYQHQCRIVAITDAKVDDESRGGIPLIDMEYINDVDFDWVVIASWAVNDIADKLQAKGVNKATVKWFQHNKNRIVDYDHPDALESHPEYTPDSVLYAFYDLDVARATFDVLGFLCLADLAREQHGCASLHLVVVNASNNEFNIAARGILNTSEHIWRKRQILAQCCGLLPQFSGMTFTSTRQEAQLLFDITQHRFPAEYSVETPVACWEFDNLFRETRQGRRVARLQASEQAQQIVQGYLHRINPEKKKVVCVTLRQSAVKPARNSNLDAWEAFIGELDKNTYLPVILPDTEDSWGTDFQMWGAQVFSEACFNVELRMAIYELSYINLGVNNGPMHLCALSHNCRYIMYKQVTEDYAHTSTQSFTDRGFEIGGGFAGATRFQRLVWQDDELEVIRHSFEQMAEDINSCEVSGAEVE